MEFRTLIHGYRVATSDVTADEYVIRTRPKGDGWIAINDTEGLVLATGLRMHEAIEVCRSYDKHVAAAITLI